MTSASLIFLAPMLVTLVLHGDAPRRAQAVTLLYVGAEDCAPCRVWQRGLGASFRASPEFAALSYREVKSPTLHAVLDDTQWPADLQGYRQNLGPDVGVPLWLIIADERVRMKAYGESQ